MNKKMSKRGLRVTRRHVRAWLDPIRKCFTEMSSGSVDSIRGYAVTRLTAKDNYARTDYCIAGFRALIQRVSPELDAAPLLRIEKRLAAGVPVTIADLNEACAYLRKCEDVLILCTKDEVKSAVLTEQILIELDEERGAA